MTLESAESELETQPAQDTKTLSGTARGPLAASVKEDGGEHKTEKKGFRRSSGCPLLLLS